MAWIAFAKQLASEIFIPKSMRSYFMPIEFTLYVTSSWRTRTKHQAVGATVGVATVTSSSAFVEYRDAELGMDGLSLLRYTGGLGVW